MEEFHQLFSCFLSFILFLPVLDLFQNLSLCLLICVFCVGYLLDPHTAVAMAVAKKFQSARGQVPLLICATAHYAKFPATVLQALGKVSHSGSPLEMMSSLEELNASPVLHNRLRDIISSTVSPHIVLPPSLSSVMAHIKSLL